MSEAVSIAVIDQLVAEKRAQIQGEKLVIAGAAPAISAKETQRLQEVIAVYSKAGLAAPSVKEAALQLRIGEAEMRRLITLLIREKTLVRMGSDDVFVHSDAVRKLAGKLGPMKGKTIDVAAFKELTGLTRKHAIPLLELLDRDRVTRKQVEILIVL